MGNDTIWGVAGNDLLYGGPGNDEIHGGAGNDYIVGNPGNDKLYAGNGTNVIWGGTAIFNSSPVPDPTAFQNQILHVYFNQDGTPIVNTDGSLLIPTVPGNPTGLDGNDIIYGGARADYIFAGNGNNTVFGGTGQEYIDGGAGQDLLFAGGGNSVVRGGDGNDTLVGGSGLNRLYGDGGDDHLYAGAPNQTLYGGDGNDSLYAWAAYDLSATAAQLAAVVLQAGDEMHGGTGDDTLYGNLGRDTLYGDDGNDTLYGDDLAGPITVGLDGMASLMVNTLAATSGGDDLIYGGAGDDQIFAGGGNDTVYGGPGDDFIDGQDGFNVLYGEGGKDSFVAQTDPSPTIHYQNVGNLIDGAYQSGQDDQATNILLVNGTQGSDTMTLAEPDVSLTASADAPVNGQLQALTINGTIYSKAFFTLTLNSTDDPTLNGNTYSVSADVSETTGFQTVKQLVHQINTDLPPGLVGKVEAREVGGRVSLATTGLGHLASLVLGAANPVTMLELHLGDSQQAMPLQPAAQLVGLAAAPATGKLTDPLASDPLTAALAPAIFFLSVNNAPPVQVKVDSGAGNTTVAQLVLNVQAALVTAQLASEVLAGQVGNKISLTTVPTVRTGSLVITSPNAVAQSELHFADGQDASALPVQPTAQLVAQGDAPATGKLTDPVSGQPTAAVFDLSVNGAAPVQVTVNSRPTNTGVTDLANDIQTALTTAGLAA
jgi:hypothetical protein